MDGDIISFVIPLAAIIGGIGAKAFRNWTQHEQKMVKIRGLQGIRPDGPAQSEIEALKRELAQIRDTTTRYDVSVEQALSEMQHRLSRLESGEIPPRANPWSPRPPQYGGEKPVGQRIVGGG